MTAFRSAGFFGYRSTLLCRYLFTERNRINCRRLAKLGPWEVWCKP